MITRARKEQPHEIFKVMECELPYDKLPLNREVIGRIIKLRKQKMLEQDKVESQISVRQIITEVAAETIALWDRAAIPAKRKDKVEDQIFKLWKEMDAVRKGGRSHAWKEAAGDRLRSKMESLCDIALAVEKVKYIAFLEDQRSVRSMIITAPHTPRPTNAGGGGRPGRPRRKEEPTPPAAQAGLAAQASFVPVFGPRPAAQAAARAMRDSALGMLLKDGVDDSSHDASETTGLCGSTAASSATEPGASGLAGPSAAGSSSVMDSTHQSTASTISAVCDDPDYVPPPPRETKKPDLTSLAEAIDEAGTSSRKALALLSTQQSSVATRTKLRVALKRAREGKLRSIGERTAACTAVFFRWT